MVSFNSNREFERCFLEWFSSIFGYSFKNFRLTFAYKTSMEWKNFILVCKKLFYIIRNFRKREIQVCACFQNVEILETNVEQELWQWLTSSPRRLINCSQWRCSRARMISNSPGTIILCLIIFIAKYSLPYPSLNVNIHCF